MKQLLSIFVLVLILSAVVFSQSREFTTYEVTYFIDDQIKTVPTTLNMRLTDYSLTVTDPYNITKWTFTDDIVYLAPGSYFASARDNKGTPCKVSFETTALSETVITIRYQNYRIKYKARNN
jgi:hypothetical protein